MQLMKKFYSVQFLYILCVLIFLFMIYTFPKSEMPKAYIGRYRYGVDYHIVTRITFNDTGDRHKIAILTEESLVENLKHDKGTGCKIYKSILDLSLLGNENRTIQCSGIDWIKCYLSKCTVNPEIWNTIYDLKCVYYDLFYVEDSKFGIKPSIILTGNHTYKMNVTDYVKIMCLAKSIKTKERVNWIGHGAGFRPVTPLPPPPGREKTYNILIICFDSASRKGFKAYMPKTIKFLREEFKAVIMRKYNIIGDGTSAAIFPLLTGKTELELPDEIRRGFNDTDYIDSLPFLFYKLKEDGYRTAYFEDMPLIGTFFYRYNGFKKQPTDHYMRTLFMAALDNDYWDTNSTRRFCIGDTPVFKTMLNLTDQFFQLDAKKFAFTFLSDISHDDFSWITNADEPMVDFLRGLMQRGVHNRTLIIVMGDHGVRYGDADIRLVDKLMQRLPLMAIRLPDELMKLRPLARRALEHNADVLTTPHDIYATMLDVVYMKQHWNPYKVKGADLSRGLSLLEPIPQGRSCSEAGIEPHWCVCFKWEMLESTHEMYSRAPKALLAAINEMTNTARLLCAFRVLTKVHWVKSQQLNKKMLRYQHMDGFNAMFTNTTPFYNYMHYMVKISISPEEAIFEATVTHNVMKNIIVINPRQISRINAVRVDKMEILGSDRLQGELTDLRQLMNECCLWGPVHLR